MDIFPIWKSTFYETEEDSVKFRILKWGVQEICRATAVRLPDDELLRIGLNKPCQGYLDSNIEVSATGTTISNAYAEFSLQIWNASNSQWFNAYEFAFVNDWSYGEHEETGSFSEPINGHAAPGQLIPYTICSTSTTQETICYDEYEFTAYLTVTPSTIAFDQTGGTATITIFSNTNWYITQIGSLVSLSQYQGGSGTTTVTVYCNENTSITELTGTLRIRADKRGTTAIEYVSITQDAASPYVRVVSGGDATFDTGASVWNVTYQTNLPELYYRMSDGTNTITGYTSGGRVSFNLPPVDEDTSYTLYFYDEPGGTLYAYTTAEQVLGPFFSLSDASIGYTGGTVYMPYRTNYEEGEYYVVVDTGLTLISYNNGNVVVSVPVNSGRKTIQYNVKVYRYSDNQLISTGVVSQTAQYYFNFTTDDSQTIPARTTSYTVNWDTNYPSVVYVFNGISATTSNHFATLTFPENTSTASTVPYSISVYTTGGTLLGVLDWEQNRKKDLSEYEGEYFTLDIVSAGTICVDIIHLTGFYSLDGGDTWVEILADPTNINVNAGDRVMFKGQYYRDPGTELSTLFYFSGTTAYYNAEGNIMSLQYGDDFVGKDRIVTHFSELFRDSNIVSAENLVLPKASLGYRCYGATFRNCRYLTTPPVLPSTSLGEECYYTMFQDCYSLTTAPELPATVLADGCYSAMFDGCRSLTVPPVLPADTVASECYISMFRGCTSLTKAPDLPAVGHTYGAVGCYERMFYGCYNLLTAPSVIPLSSMPKDCCKLMFYNCSSLTTAPELPTEYLSEGCYGQMFKGCTSLVTAPELPATMLAEGCYYAMFSGCTSITAAPELMATRLVRNCYEEMFNGCSSLSSIKCLATSGYGTQTQNWVSGVSQTGTFTKVATSYWGRGASGIPSGWTVIDA